MKTKQSKRLASWYDKRLSAVLLCAVALIVGYLLGSRAIDTGSLQQYFLTFVIFCFAVNRLFHAVLPHGGKHA
jgi:lipopolysaccharide export LptBFGC system permease protein LptF